MDKERVAGLLFLSIGIYGLVFSLTLPLGKWDEPGPGGFPLSISIFLFLLGLSKLFHRKEKGEKKEEEIINLGKTVRSMITPLKILGITLAFILTMEWMGYLLAASVYLFILFFWVSRFRIWVAMGLTLVIGLGSWYFFGKILSVSLPAGLLPL